MSNVTLRPFLGRMVGPRDSIGSVGGWLLVGCDHVAHVSRPRRRKPRQMTIGLRCTDGGRLRMSRWTAVAAVVLCCGLSGIRVLAQSPRGGVVTFQMDRGDGGAAVVRYSVRTGSLRLDLYSDTTPDANEISQVFNVRQGTWIVLMARAKTYIQMPVGRINLRHDRADSDPPRHDSAPGDTSHLAATGRTETIAGVVCNDYAGHSNGIGYEACLAPAMQDFIPFSLPLPLNTVAGDSGVIRTSILAFLQRGAFPLKIAVLRDGRMSRIVATQVSRDVPDSSLFSVPKDYRPMFGQLPTPAPQ
jgi:hypothetical protein